jgi:hypothetical protein
MGLHKVYDVEGEGMGIRLGCLYELKMANPRAIWPPSFMENGEYVSFVAVPFMDMGIKIACDLVCSPRQEFGWHGDDGDDHLDLIHFYKKDWITAAVPVDLHDLPLYITSTWKGRLFDMLLKDEAMPEERLKEKIRRAIEIHQKEIPGATWR